MKEVLPFALVQDDQEMWQHATTVAVVVGSQSERHEIRYLKSIAVQHWFFSYEIPGNSAVNQQGTMASFGHGWVWELAAGESVKNHPQWYATEHINKGCGNPNRC